jgi:hypothetical protein
VSLIEGEPGQDGTALVLYGGVARRGALSGTFSLPDTSGRIVVRVAGGIGIELAVGWIVRQVRCCDESGQALVSHSVSGAKSPFGGESDVLNWIESRTAR